MQIPNQLPQLGNEKALIVVSAKEKGIVYFASDGEIEKVAEVEEHPETYSDREGFFAQAGPNMVYGTGAPAEVNNEHNLKMFVRTFTEKLNTLVKTRNPDIIYLFYPEHFKGYLEKNIVTPTHTPFQVIAYGNFLHLGPLALLKQIQDATSVPHDPTDPSSVANGPHAAEKRRILGIGLLRVL